MSKKRLVHITRLDPCERGKDLVKNFFPFLSAIFIHKYNTYSLKRLILKIPFDLACEWSLGIKNENKNRLPESGNRHEVGKQYIGRC